MKKNRLESNLAKIRPPTIEIKQNDKKNEDLQPLQLQIQPEEPICFCTQLQKIHQIYDFLIIIKKDIASAFRVGDY